MVTRTRLVRWIAGACALVVLSGAYWRVGIDDAFITAAYAVTLLERGALAWPGEPPFEGYSSLPWVLVHAVALHVHLDPILIAKLVATGCGLGIVALATTSLPATRAGHWTFAALVCFTPLAIWSAMPMEASLFALLVSAAWVLASSRRPQLTRSRLAGLLAAAACLVRPEGVAWLALIAVAAVRRAPAARRPFAVAGIVAAGYHAARWHYFGALFPGPVLLKARLDWMGVVQLVLELTGALGVLVAVRRFFVRRGAGAWWAHAPLILSAALLLAIGGDWMGDARILLPGVVATACGAPGFADHTPSARLRWDTIAAIAVASVLSTPFLEPPRPRRLLPTWGDGLDTPLAALVDPLVRYAPAGASVQCADVGAVAHIPGLTVMDGRGLVSPMFSDARRTGDWSPIRALYASDDAPDVIVVSRFLPTWVALIGEDVQPYAGLDPWLRHLDAELARYPHRRDLLTRERGWIGAISFHHRAEPRVDRALWRERASALHTRFPAHPWLTWQLALSLAANDQSEAASATLRDSGHADLFPLSEAPHSLAFPEGSSPALYVAGRGFVMPAKSSRTSRPLAGSVRLLIDSDQPQTLTVRIGERPSTHVLDAGRSELAFEVVPPGRLTVTVEDRVHIDLR